MSVINYVNPFRIYKDLVRKPIETFLFNQYLGYRKKTGEGINSAKEIIYKVAIILVFLTAILWLSIFNYIVFYHMYMPNITHQRTVHFQFKPCEETMGICSFPYAYVQLTRKSSILMSGQLYRIRLILEMPESNVNKDLGMFMVCTQMRAKGGVLVSSSCRSTMLRYRSKLHEYIRTAVMAPLLMSDVVEEKQTIQVDLFTEFDDDPNQPVTDAYVELQSRYVQVYGGQLHIEAHFTGLRYLMYNWPKFSALFGISTNLFFITLVFALSWYHLQEGLPEFIKSKLGTTPDKDEDDKKLIGKIKLEKEESPSMFEGDVLLEEFMQLEEKEKKTS